jgi:Uma2 family endonuclease
MAKGIEPDECFYIQNAARTIGKDRLDLTIDPPPDLAIEIDVTSKTGLEAYRALGVPELWRFEDGKLRISLLQDGGYRDADFSPIFPGLPIVDLVSQSIELSYIQGRSQTLKAFRQQIRSVIQS